MKKKSIRTIKQKPKNQFAFDGYIKVGRIRQTIARAAHIKSADIMVNANHVKHIALKHSEELKSCGITTLEYIELIVNKYTEIRQNKGESLLLVKRNDPKDADTVTIELLYNDVSHFWEVKTAQPRRNLSNNELLWPQI